MGEDHLRQRDLKGKPFTGELADNYLLRRGAPRDKAARMSTDPRKPTLEGTHWMLMELIGKQVTEAEEHDHEAHIVFDAQEKRAAGSATADAFRGGVKMVRTGGITLPEA